MRPTLIEIKIQNKVLEGMTGAVAEGDRHRSPMACPGRGRQSMWGGRPHAAFGIGSARMEGMVCDPILFEVRFEDRAVRRAPIASADPLAATASIGEIHEAHP